MQSHQRYSLDNLVRKEYGVMAGLDPRLQRIIVRSLEDVTRGPAKLEDETAVIARISDVRAWADHPSVRSISVSPILPDRTVIATGRVPVNRIQGLRRESFVLSLKAAHRVRRQLSATVPELAANQLPETSASNGGKGVVIGIIDNGCDFAHPNFRTAAGATRLVGIWDQSQPLRPVDAGRVKYGRFFTTDEINAALRHGDPYSALGYSPAQGAHGTHVMDIAAGNGLGTGQAGIAPQADLLFVEISAGDAAIAAALPPGLGDSVHLVEAVSLIFETAGTLPCVVNVSLGSNSGPHDGSSLVERMFDSITAAGPNRCIAVAAGNAFADGIHFGGHLGPGSVVDLDWVLDDPLADDAELEIWYAGDDRFTVDILSPDGRLIVSVPAGGSRNLTVAGHSKVMVSNRLADPNNGDNQIAVFLGGGAPGGIWKVRLHAVAAGNGDFHAWIERDDSDQSAFDSDPADNTHTISSLAGGCGTIVVGAYSAHDVAKPLHFGSAAGPTRDGRPKPDVSAPGVNVAAANARQPGTLVLSGTSMAAPATTGAIALLVAEAHAKGVPLSAADIRKQLFSSAPPAPAADPRYGVGRVSAGSLIQQFLTAHP
jgi:subtilisin family serine protease